jgi:hypothetical protein
VQKSRSSGTVVLRARTRAGSEYHQALREIIALNRRIPALELAVWRYRFEIPEGVTEERSLVEALVSELHLSDEERAIVLREDLPS